MAKGQNNSLSWITDAIAGASRSMQFCASGNVPSVKPGLTVEGVGAIKLPLMPKQAKELIAVGRVAPFGKGTKTLTDTKVRRTIEVDASQIQLSDAWNQMISGLVASVGTELGLETDQLEANLYKLLLYETGGHFKPHRDSEKLNRMVASLVVMLPTEFSGGELVVEHEGSRQTFNFDAARKKESACYVAFYADCQHEVKRVQRGRRLCLTYNLVLKKRWAKKSPERPVSETEVLADAMRQYVGKQPRETLVFAFEHQYTQKGLSQELLKGADRSLAELVIGAAELAGCRVYLAQVERHLMQFADDGSWGSQRRWDHRKVNVANLELGESYEDDLHGSEWHDLNGKSQPIGAIRLSKTSIVSRTPLDDWVPTSEEYEGYTGNAGNTLDRWYHRSAIVVWHDNDHFDILARGGCHNSIELFDSMRAKLTKTPKKRLEQAEQECWQLARAILRQWPSLGGYAHRYDNGKDDSPWLREFIETVGALADDDLIRNVLSVMSSQDKETPLDKFIFVACKRFGVSRFESQLIDLLNAPISKHDSAVAPREFRWLSKLACDKMYRGTDESLRKLCSIATSRFIASYAAQRTGRMEIKIVCQCLHELIRALTANGCVDELRQCIAAVQANPEAFRLDIEQSDCLLTVVPWCAKSGISVSPPLLTWLDDARRQLRDAATVRPEKPTTWQRPAALKCDCVYCVTLNTFLVNSMEEMTSIAAAEHQRSHMGSEVRRSGADVDARLEKRGSPYRLVFTKTLGSYELAVKQFDADSAMLARLDAMAESVSQNTL